MTTVSDIINAIEEAAPLSLAYGWDNPGLLAGSRGAPVSKVLAALDADLSAVREAAREGCEMIVAHHPILFGGTKNICCDSPDGMLVKAIIESGVALYAAHTNMDKAADGINARLAAMLGLKNVRILEPDAAQPDAGMGRVGELEKPLSPEEFCKLVKSALGVPCVRTAGGAGLHVSTVGIVSGSGAEYIRDAKAAGCDAFLTGDVKYHEAQNAAELGLFVVDAGHFHTEKIVTDIFAGLLKKTGVQVVYPHAGDIFKFV